MMNNDEYDTIILALDVDNDRGKMREAASVFVMAETFAKQIMVTVNGYDDDPREVWQVPEVLAYLRDWYQIAKAGGAKFTCLDDISRSLLLYANGKGRIVTISDGDYRFETLGEL